MEAAEHAGDDGAEDADDAGWEEGDEAEEWVDEEGEEEDGADEDDEEEELLPRALPVDGEPDFSTARARAHGSAAPSRGARRDLSRARRRPLARRGRPATGWSTCVASGARAARPAAYR